METDLLESCTLDGDTLKLEKQSYRVVVVEDGLLISDAQQAVLDNFEAAGGAVIYVADFCDDAALNTLKQFNPLALKPLTNPEDLRITHVIKDGVHFYMMVNESNEPIDFEAFTAVTGRKEIWNPWEGTFTEVADADNISIKLDALEALILAVEA